jgi:hypothetical protein
MAAMVRLLRRIQVPFEAFWLCLGFAMIPVLAPLTNPTYWHLVWFDLKALFGF